MQGLYIHVPFCPTICPYCDFQVVRRHGGIVEAYLVRLASEARALYQQYPNPPQTVYFGGGTPSFLRGHELVRLREALPWRFEGAEVTMEANPGTLNRERLGLLKDLGINRLSIGVQSFQDSVLRTLGRAHGRKGAFQAVEMALEAGFRVSIDLILGLPEQDFESDLMEAAGLGIGHVSAYTLQIEPGTPFEVNQVRLDEDLEATAFEGAEAILGAVGLLRYEVSNFARPGQESQHNQLYWKHGFWGALGPGAAGHFAYTGSDSADSYSVRTLNPPLPRWLAGERPNSEAISPLEHAKEALMLGLRLRSGVDLAALEQRTGLPLWDRLGPAITRLEQEGRLEPQGQAIRTTNLGLVHPVILRLWEALEDGWAMADSG